MTTEMQVFDNGPVLVKGENLVLKDAEGNTYDLEGKPNIALCRCGSSSNKPFCDGAHKDSGFSSECRASS